MVELHLLDGLGNILFQYAYARIVAEAKGYALRVRPEPSIRSTDHGPGTSGSTTLTGPTDYYPALDALFGGVPHLSGQELETNPLFVVTPNVAHLHGHPDPAATVACDQRLSPADHRRILDHHGKIVIQSWLQDYRLFGPRRAELVHFFQPRGGGDIPGEGDVVMHMRLGDYEHSSHTLPLEYYRAMVRRFRGRTVVCVTDAPSHPYVDALAAEPNFSLYDNSGVGWAGLDEASRQVVADFGFLCNTRGTLVLSNSTFAWWAAFLSPAAEVVHPLVSKETLRRITHEGAMTIAISDRRRYDPFWILDDTHPSRPNLLVDDQPRWTPEVI